MKTAKAVAGGLVSGVVYLIGIIPASGGFEDVHLVGWLGLIPVMAAAWGIVYEIPNKEA